MILTWIRCIFLIVIGIFLVATQSVNDLDIETNYIRPQRFAHDNGGIFGFFMTLVNIKKIYDEQYNDTRNSLQQVYNIVSDGFSDTATSKRPTILPASYVQNGSSIINENGTVVVDDSSTTTERYRISRKELGRILRKNGRGLQKLLRLELDDAANQSQYNIKEYRREFANALTPYSLPSSTVKAGNGKK